MKAKHILELLLIQNYDKVEMNGFYAFNHHYSVHGIFLSERSLNLLINAGLLVLTYQISKF